MLPTVSKDAVSHAENVRPAIMQLELSENETTKWWNWRVAANLVIVGLGTCLYGYDNAFASPLLSLPLFVARYQGPGFAGLYAFTAKNQNLLFCVPLVGSVLGSLLATPLQKILGRKNTLIVTYTTFCIPGSILQLFAPNMGAMVFGRFWNGCGISIVTNVVPVYLSELVPADVRGRAVGFSAAGSGAVSVIATTVVWATERYNDSRQFKVPLAIQAIAPCVIGALSLLLTESPTWLLSKGRHMEARSNLMSLRCQNEHMVTKELSMAEVVFAEVEHTTGGNILEILKKGNRTRTFIASSFVPASQACGQILTLTYSTILLVQSGVADAFRITILIFLLQFMGTMIGPYLADTLGRRRLALFSFPILFAIDLSAGGLAVSGLTDLSRTKALAALCCLFSFFNALSFASLNFVLPTEIPTARLREATITWTVFWGYVTAVITTFAVPQIIDPGAGNLGAKAFLIFAGVMFIVLVYTYFLMPETAGRTLAEIDEMYQENIPVRKWRKHQTSVAHQDIDTKQDM